MGEREREKRYFSRDRNGALGFPPTLEFDIVIARAARRGSRKRENLDRCRFLRDAFARALVGSKGLLLNSSLRRPDSWP